MSFSSSDRPNPALTPIYKNVLSQFEGNLAKRLNVEQMFLLIDGLLPFEACLYHQVLPLYVEGSRFHLGMVSATDVAATDYVRRMISYVNYSLVVEPISSAALQTALSAYLNYVSAKRPETPIPLTGPEGHPPPSSSNDWSNSAPSSDQGDRQTLILDETSLRQFQEGLQDSQSFPSADVHPLSSPDTPPLQAETIVPELSSPPPPLTSKPTIDPKQRFSNRPAPEPTPHQINPNAPKKYTTPAALPPLIQSSVPVLSLQAHHRNEAIEEIGQRLSPSILLQELLVRVLETGIGRLYIEQQKRLGRVLWSENGVLKAVVDQLKPDYCQSLINELKRLVHVPLRPIETPQQTEVERIYGNEHILLRCRFMRGVHGEEATLQVLRGAALRFYEQKQIDRLGDDALILAHDLNTKLAEIRSRANVEPKSVRGNINKLLDLQKALDQISDQLHDLQTITDEEP